MNRKTMKKKSYLFDSTLVTALFAAVLTMGACAENDLENRNSEGDKGATVSFEVKDVQEAVLADDTPDSRANEVASYYNQLRELSLTSEDLEPQVLEAQAPEGMEACLVETTIPGINPVQPDPKTRATVTNILTTDFSTLGYRGTSETNISSTPDWFYNARTKSNGELYNKLYWNWSGNRFGRFYGVYPEVKNTYTKIKLSPSTHPGYPYVEFEVEPNVLSQKDLMTACSGVVEYRTQGVAPKTYLPFRHALTAIHFSVGQNLWAGRITKIEISGAISKGTYTLGSDLYQLGTWALGTTTGTFTLDGIDINTAASPGSVITNSYGNYTFFMIPQQVTGKNIYVKIHFQDGKTIHVPLKGKWLPGTTKIYTLSNRNSNWDYQIEVLGQNNTVAYDATNAGTYTVRSYRQAGGVQLPVAWKVVSYQESADGGAHFGPETTTRPHWLDKLSLTEGTGGTTATQGTVTVKKASTTDYLSTYNKVLQDAIPKGSAGNYYDLSTHDFKGNATSRNTANSYLISAPGYYKIPLVYGNAIKNGATNESAYKTTHTGPKILSNFRDHDNQNITNPWITLTNGGMNAPDGVKIVWTDQSGIVEQSSLRVTGSGTNAFVQFRVPGDKIKNGNAVIAVTKGGVVVWSWHLWFNHKEALETVRFTNHDGVDYYFAKQTLGLVYRKWEKTVYALPRVARVKVEQTMGNNGMKKFAYIDITQKPGAPKEIAATLYQFGRKEAMAGVESVSDGFFSRKNNIATSDFFRKFIQHPELYYNLISGLSATHYDFCNIWSMETTRYDNDPVVKTIYDPNPAGFKVPETNAFTGFAPDGFDNHNPSGDWDMGYHFKGADGINTAFFAAAGVCHTSGKLLYVGESTVYNLAHRYSESGGCWAVSFSKGFIRVKASYSIEPAYAIHPVAE